MERRASAIIALFAAAALLGIASCRDGDAPSEPAPAAPFAPNPGATLAACDTFVAVLVDGLTREALDGAAGGALPNLAALRAGGLVFTNAVAASTAGNAALASVLSGERPDVHGVRSIHDPGRARLAPEVTTFPETLAAAGWTTVASVAAKRESRGIGGFDQGFARFDDVRGTELARPALSVALGFVDVAAEALATDAPVFALLTFADLSRDVKPALDHPRALEFARARLAHFSTNDAELEDILRRGALDELAARYSRSRGTGQARAYAAGVRDVQLASIDDAVGRVLAELERTGRAERALVLVAGTRGEGPTVTGPKTPRIPRSVVEVALLVRAPGSGGAATVEGLAPVRLAGAAAARALLGARASGRGALEPEAFLAPHAATFNARGDVLAITTADGLGYERYLDDTRVRVTSEGLAEPLEGGASVPEPPLYGTFAIWHPGEAPVEVAWKVSQGGARVLGAEGRGARPNALGKASFESKGGGVALALPDRNAALRLEVRGAGLAPTDVAFGADPSTSIAELAVPFVPIEDGPPLVSPDEDATVVFTRGDGHAWTLSVRGEGPCEALVTVWPPREVDDRLELLRGGGVVVRDVPGRRDLVHLVGELPIEVEIWKRTSESFAVVCSTSAGFVPPSAMVFDGSRFAADGAFAFVAPAWQPAVSERIGDPLRALVVEGKAEWSEVPPASVAPGPTLVIARSADGPSPGAGSGLDPDLLELLKRLSPGE